MNNLNLPVAIIGSGPIGLAAAAHLIKRGQEVVVFEAGTEIAASVLSWKHVRMFSPWQYNLDKVAASLLKAQGWVEPPGNDLPTGQELVEQYLRPLAELPQLKSHIQLNSRVVAVGRRGLDKVITPDRENQPFVLYVEQFDRQITVEARAVIDASGTWTQPNPVGSSGITSQRETAAKDHIYYGIPDVLGKHQDRYSGKHVLVVGSGHSAINTVLELAELKAKEPATHITWALRKPEIQDIYGGEEQDELAARGALGMSVRRVIEAGKVQIFTPFHISAILNGAENLTAIGYSKEGTQTVISNIAEIITCTGSRPNLSFLREIRLSIDQTLESVAALATLIDPNIHRCGTVKPHGEKELRQPEKDFYIVGMKSYGRAPNFLLVTGYEQVRSVVAALTGDWATAQEVILVLPKTGVCFTSSSACCKPI